VVGRYISLSPFPYESDISRIASDICCNLHSGEDLLAVAEVCSAAVAVAVGAFLDPAMPMRTPIRMDQRQQRLRRPLQMRTASFMRNVALSFQAQGA